ncbi:polyketide synthase [Moniliophthora roreri MCA 2997]|uniref:Polyketide synthase n=2 Tax=Moniliophthora roreri TaxID=221103 RepID=V2XSH8_MONRO|nr:polyketide synthase [Moniliophthora roreri MCA 2997]KAI3616183.1 polyketide synthase [Moniliophthora roreri]
MPQLNTPFFAGLGNAAINKAATRELAKRDACSPSGSFLLSACHHAFVSELSTLPVDTLNDLAIDLRQFQTAESLIAIPQSHTHYTVFSSSTLFLTQALRYLSYVESVTNVDTSRLPFDHPLGNNGNLGVLGFSAGILTACLVATSSTVTNYTSRAVEIYRLVLWMGIRCQLYRNGELKRIGHPRYNTASWSTVFLGLTRASAEDALVAFNTSCRSTLFITAVVGDTSITISGRPDLLEAFASGLPGVRALSTTVDALYHSPSQGAIRAQILGDLVRRDIRFPNYADLRVPLRSTFTGHIIDAQATTGTLLETILDMVLLQPINWDIVVDSLVRSVPDADTVRLLNFGPGAGIVRSMERRFPLGQSSVLDVSLNAFTPPTTLPPDAIAVIGMAVHMPGANDTAELWNVLENGLNMVSEIPEHKFRVSDYNTSMNGSGGRAMKAHTGNFIDGVDEFDNDFFKISPREARDMDPQQRVLLHTAYHALENAGYVPDATPCFRRDRFGCFIGSATHDYVQNLHEDIDVYYSPGTLKSFLSGRISYALQFGGPSIVVDTACSSSLVAVYQGVRALLNSDCDAAIVGGVNIISSPDLFIGLDRGHFLSPTGQCKPFDASADGYSRSEGCGLFVLKRLKDALAENDSILGLLRGVEVNQSGLAHSITHPHAPTQVALFEQLLKKTGIPADRVDVVEAHGTGTQAGDPVEIESIRAVFSRQRTASNPLHITSIKANIGHLEAASGAAGLAKLLLMMRHQSIPQQISLQTLNPRILPLHLDHTRIATEHVSWESSHHGLSRVALLNNFGASGSNAAAIIEEYIPSSVSSEPPSDISYVFGLSAKSEVALEQLRLQHLDWLASPISRDLRLSDIAYTMTARRQIHPYRLSVSSGSREDLVEKLAQARIVHTTSTTGQAVFVFSGQGAQYTGMGSGLYHTCPLFKSYIDLCHSILLKAGFPGILSVVLPELGESMSLPEEIEAFQAAIFSIEFALAKLWISWGVSPTAVVGHSLGEYAALVIAEVINLEDALMLVATRAHLMTSRCEMYATAMLAITLGAGELHAVLKSSDNFAGLSIACFNSTQDSVVSGSLSQLTHLKQYLDTQKRCKSTMLSVPFGYHSEAMQPLLVELTAFANGITIRSPTVPIVSNVHGVLIQPGDASVFTPAYFSRHCVEPVRFESGIQSLASSSVVGKLDAWIEIGPHSSTLPLIKSCVSPIPGILLASIRRQQNPWLTLTTSLSQLYCSNFELRWREVFEHIPSAACVDLPPYPFAKNKFWIKYRDPGFDLRDDRSSRKIDYAMLGSWVQYPSSANGMTTIFETPVKVLSDFITGHRVGKFPLCPASVYVELLLAGVHTIQKLKQNYNTESHVSIDDLQFNNPLVHDPDVPRTITTRISWDDGCGIFTIGSRLGANGEVVHASGRYHILPVAEANPNINHALPTTGRIVSTTLHDDGRESPEVFSRRTAYEIIFPRIVEYSREYHTMQTLTVGTNGRGGFALIRIPPSHSGGPFVIHPVFTDTLFHVAGFIINLQAGVEDAFICSSVASLRALPTSIDNNAPYQVCCHVRATEDGKARVADVYAVSTTEPRHIVAQASGVEFRRLRLNSLTKSLSLAVGKSDMKQKPPVQRIHSSPEIRTALPSKLQSPEEAIEEKVIQIISDTSGVSRSSITQNTDLSAIGVDSLMFIEILGLIKHVYWDLNLDTLALQSCDQVLDIVRHVASAPSIELSCTDSSVPDSHLFSDMSIPESSMSNDSVVQIETPFTDKIDSDLDHRLEAACKHLRLDEIPVLIRRCHDDNKAPLFMIHDGSGLVNYYERLPDINRTIWAIHNPHFRASQRWKDIQEMASAYAGYISSITTEPVFLGGWSFGGVVAYEVALQLQIRRITVQGIILIDSPNPMGHVPLSGPLIQAAMECNSIDRSSLGPVIVSQFEECIRLLQCYDPHSTGGTCPPLVMLRSSRGFECTDISSVPNWLSDRSNPRLSVSGWEDLTEQPVKIIDIPGHHFEPFQAVNIGPVSQAIVAGLEYLENSCY